MGKILDANRGRRRRTSAVIESNDTTGLKGG
jgi:hypothetical protein